MQSTPLIGPNVVFADTELPKYLRYNSLNLYDEYGTIYDTKSIANFNLAIINCLVYLEIFAKCLSDRIKIVYLRE